MYALTLFLSLSHVWFFSERQINDDVHRLIVSVNETKSKRVKETTIVNNTVTKNHQLRITLDVCFFCHDYFWCVNGTRHLFIFLGFFFAANVFLWLSLYTKNDSRIHLPNLSNQMLYSCDEIYNRLVAQINNIYLYHYINIQKLEKLKTEIYRNLYIFFSIIYFNMNHFM